MSTHESNRRAWDAMAQRGDRFARPASDADFQHALRQILGDKWLGNLYQQRVLCLAAGGGRQGPLYAAAGADVTVVDISSDQLSLDREVAAARRLSLRTVQTSMDDLSMFAAGEFDLVVQPVSTCYLPNLPPTYLEVARVTRVGGVYVSQHKQPASLQAATIPAEQGYELVEPYYRSGPLPPVQGSLHREAGTWEYLHRWEELVGSLCRAGFVIEDLCEPRHGNADQPRGSFAHRSLFVAPYVRIKARRTGVKSPEPRTIVLHA